MRELIPRWFIAMLLINVAVVLAYCVWNMLRGRKAPKSWVIRACTMLLCPLVGAGYFLLSWLLFRLVFHENVDLSDVIFSKERVRTASKADEEMERNFVPLEEAIAVTDRRNLRELMLNVVREDYRDSLRSIALAMNSPDSETSHYAASVLQDALNDFRTGVQKDYQKVMDGLDRPEPGEEAAISAASLIGFMNEMLQKRVFTELEQAHYTKMMDAVGERLFERQGERIDCGLMEQIALRLLDIRNDPLCEKWCLRICRMYPDTLSAFTTRMKLYFSNGEREKFFQVMEQLKKSNIVIDRETLELIRTFS